MEVGLPDVRPSMHLSLQQWTWRQSWDDWDLKWWNSVNLRPSLAKKSRALLLTRHSVWETSSPLLFQAMEIWGLFHFLYFLKILFIYFFLEREEGKEKERERNISVWLPLVHSQLGGLASNPFMFPDWESNQWPFGSQACAQSTQLHQPGLGLLLIAANLI